jgi:hypothetical protein
VTVPRELASSLGPVLLKTKTKDISFGKLAVLLFFLFHFFLFICVYNIWVISPPFHLPPLLSPCLPYPPYPSLPGRNYFVLISNFVEEKREYKQ